MADAAGVADAAGSATVANPGRRRLHLVVALFAAAVVVVGLLPALGRAAPSPSIEEVQQRVDALTLKVDQAVEDYQEASVKLDRRERRAEAAKGKVAESEAKLAELQEAMGDVAAGAYRSGGSLNPIVALITTQSPQVFLDRASSLDQLAQNQAAGLASIKAARKDLAEARAVAEAQVEAQRKVKHTLAAKKDEINATLAEQQQLLESLKEEQRQRLAALQAQREAEARARAEAARAARAARAASAARAAAERKSGSSESGDRDTAYSGPASGRASAAIDYAMAQLGDPYVWAAAGPNAFDCSGLTMRAWEAAGVSLPHSSRMQYRAARHVSNPRPGDLLFYGSPIHHVTIYIGNGQQIAAPHSGTVVQIQPAFRGDYVGAARP